MSEDCFTLSTGKNEHMILAKILCENEDSTHIVTVMNTTNNRRVLVDRKTFHLVSRFNQANCIYKIFDENQVTVHTCFVYNFVTSKKTTCTFVDNLINYIMHRRFPKNGNFLQFCKIEMPVCADYVYSIQKNVKSIDAMEKPEKLCVNQIAQTLAVENEMVTIKFNELKVPVKQKVNSQLTSYCTNDINCRTNIEQVSTNIWSNKNKTVMSTQLVNNMQDTADRKNVQNTSLIRKVPILQPYASMNLDQSMNIMSEIEKIPEVIWTIKPYDKLQKSSIIEESERLLKNHKKNLQTTSTKIQSNIHSIYKSHSRDKQNSLVPMEFETKAQEIDKTGIQSVQCHISDVSRIEPTTQCNSTMSELSDGKSQQKLTPIKPAKHFLPSVLILNKQKSSANSEVKNAVNHKTQNVELIQTMAAVPSYYFVRMPNIPTSVQQNHCSIEASNTAEQASKIPIFETSDKTQAENTTTDIKQNIYLPSTSNNEIEQLPLTQQVNLDAGQIPYPTKMLPNESTEVQPLQINEHTTPLTDLSTSLLRQELQKKPARKKFKQADTSSDKIHTLSKDSSMNCDVPKLVHRNKEDLTFNLFHHKGKVLHISGLTKCSEQNELNTLQYVFQVLNRCAKKTTVKEFELEMYKECITSNMIRTTKQNQRMENDINSLHTLLVSSISVPKIMQKKEEDYSLFTDQSDNDNDVTKTNEEETALANEISKDELLLSLKSKVKERMSTRSSSRPRKLNVRNLYDEYQYPYKRASGSSKDRYDKNKEIITASINISKSNEKNKININETLEDTFTNEKLTNTESTSNDDEIKLYDEILYKKYNIKNCNVRVARIDRF